MNGDRPTNVLVVEDNPGDALLIETALEDAGENRFRMHLAPSLAAAWKTLSETSVDVILSDLALPDSSGLGTVRAIREAAPNTPIVVLTSFADDEMAIQALDVGAQDYLVKGAVEPETIVRAIHYANARVLQENQLREARKLDAVETLASGVVNDFNNLLTVIVGECTLLKSRRTLEPDVSGVIDHVQSAALQGALLVQQLANYCGQRDSAQRVVDVCGELEDLRPLLKRLVGERTNVVLDLDAARPCVSIDPRDLTELLVQFAKNSRAAMQSGGTFTVSVRTLDVSRDDQRRMLGLRPGPYVELSIADTGIGIPADSVHRVFDPFWSGPGGGAGMGLAEVYGIAKQNRGLVTVFSERGVGTTFDVFLPLRIAPVTDAREDAPMVSGATVLVIESDPSVASLMKRALTAAGFAVIARSTQDEAVEAAANRPLVHAVLADAELASGDGLDVVQRLRIHHPDVVAIRTSSRPRRGGDALPGGGDDDMLAKPFTVQRLVDTVRGALRSARA